MKEVKVVCDSLYSLLPSVISLTQCQLAVTDICLPVIHNVNRCVTVVKADGTVYDVEIDSCYCETPSAIVEVLKRKLGIFAEVSVDEENRLAIKCHDKNTSIEFPPKLSQILGVIGVVKGDFRADYLIDPFMFTRRICLTSHMVEPSIVSGGHLSYFYFGGSDTKVDNPVYYSLNASRVNCINVTVLDAMFEPVEFGPGSMSLTLNFRSS